MLQPSQFQVERQFLESNYPSTSVLPVSAAKVFDSSADYDDPLAVYDGMDVNNSVLQILPQGWTYDFEGPNTGPNNWTLGSNWFLEKILQVHVHRPVQFQAESIHSTHIMETIPTK